MNYSYDNVAVGSASGSDYQVSLPMTSIKFLVNTATAETWLEAMYSFALDVTVGTEYTQVAPQQMYGLWYVSGTTFKQAEDSSTGYPTALDDLSYTK
jgi:hypothetical protein